VSKEVGEEERGARGGVDRRSDNATSFDVEIDPRLALLLQNRLHFAGWARAHARCRLGRWVSRRKRFFRLHVSFD